MANGETLTEVRAMLATNDFSTKEAARITLAMMADLYESVHRAQLLEDERHIKIDADLALLKKKSIVLWAEQNQSVAIFIATLALIVFLFAQDIAVPWIAKALGLP